MAMSRFHPAYQDLHDELLARPFPVLAAPVVVSHRAVLRKAEDEAGHRAAVAALAAHFGVSAPAAIHGFQMLACGTCDLRVERHHEFTSFTVIAPADGVPFGKRAIDLLPSGWEAGIPGQVIAAVEIASERLPLSRAGTTEEMERIVGLFDGERVVGGWVVDRVACVWSHYRLDDQGCSRLLVQDHRLTPGRFGRLVARLCEIETYRLISLLALPLAREYLPRIEALEIRHAALVDEFGHSYLDDGAQERSLLSALTELAVETEHLQARGETRFSATAAYARILRDRVRELREVQVPGYQTIGEFFDRRLGQALHTCESVHVRLRELHGRIHSSTGLLRTRVEVNLQHQNQRLLASVDRRSALQLRLQHAVEGLSVVVLTYYLVGLLKYLLEAMKESGAHLPSALIAGLAVPVLAGAVWWSVRRMKSHHLR